MNSNSDKKVVLITGSGRGIGRELAKEFVNNGDRVIVNFCNNGEQANQFAKEIGLEKKNGMLIKADVRDEIDVNKMFEKIMFRYGRLDILINNAGVSNDSCIDLMDIEAWDMVVDTNLRGVFLCSRGAINLFDKVRGGKIINIASWKGVYGDENQVNYCTSKAGVLGFTRALAKEVGTKNIAVNAICPGYIVTDFNRKKRDKFKNAKMSSVLPMDDCLFDLVNMTVFLCSKKIRGVSGQVFFLDSRIL